MGYYNLGAFAVLSNHVHALLLPKVSPTRLLHSLQGATGRQANRILGRPGETFWETESYHYWVRDARQWKRIVRYIEEHPVKAGLVSVAEDYRWSSAAKRAGEVRAGAA